MKYTGETAIKLAERYGLPIQKYADEHEGYRDAVPLEDAQEMLNRNRAQSLFVEAEPELAATVADPRQIRRDSGAGRKRV